MKTGVVDVGGGLRGIYAAGVLDYCYSLGLGFLPILGFLPLLSSRSASCPPSAYFLSHTFKVDSEMLYVLAAACLVIPFIKESTTSSFRSSLYPPGRLL